MMNETLLGHRLQAGALTYVCSVKDWFTDLKYTPRSDKRTWQISRSRSGPHV